ncbi:Peptidase propeptide and YPEB domain-containing protein [Micromonospora citrea]|uniref:Peptidase propeptide and YPEB domain-containing protein n=1 Tax=Micromonospora citrea TaxID=47855 RepID=A0A1C6UGU2_9ACTN|nr:PepSY domain-containing protein [Micromonospora citrea]SCL53174.1 Peptidase propeptide and YPEB domain-containing protein [Micromonospora citrea]
MKRNPLILASVGGVAALAVAGAALGVAAADGGPARATTLVAATTAPSAPTTPGGTSTGAPGSAPATGGTSATPGTPSGSGTPATGGDAVSEQRAREIALARAGGGQVVEIEAEQEDDRPVWSVEVVVGQTEHEIDVDREHGTVVKAEQEPVDDEDDDRDDDEDDSGDDD